MTVELTVIFITFLFTSALLAWLRTKDIPPHVRERQKYGPFNDALLEYLKELREEEKPKRGRVYIGDDGELIEEIEE